MQRKRQEGSKGGGGFGEVYLSPPDFGTDFKLVSDMFLLHQEHVKKVKLMFFGSFFCQKGRFKKMVQEEDYVGGGELLHHSSPCLRLGTTESKVYGKGYLSLFETPGRVLGFIWGDNLSDVVVVPLSGGLSTERIELKLSLKMP